MKAQVESAASDVSEQTETSQEVTEIKTESIPTAFESTLLKLAAEEGHEMGFPKSEKDEETEVEPEPEVTSETEVVTEFEKETEAEEETEEVETKGIPEGVDAKKEEKPKGDEWPESAKVRVAEETAKRKRANERADKAEAIAAQLQEQVAKVTLPQPTEADPFIDIFDVNALDRLERSYEKAIDLADENPDGAEEIVVGRDNDGKEIKQDFSPEQLVAMRRKAEKAIRKFIPERRKYLEQRTIADAQAVEMYPEFKEPDSEFSKSANFLAQRLLSGEAMKDPTLLVWIGHAVKGYQMSLQKNGKEKPVDSDTKKIIESSRQKIAPTPTRSRSFTERNTRGSDLVKAEKELKETGSQEAAEKYVEVVFSNRRSGANKLEPISE